LGAGSGTVNTCFPSDAISIEGELGDFKSVADSGNVMHRRFCTACGTLDDPEVAKPSVTIWTESAPTWACIDAALPTFTKQAPPAT